MHKKEKTYLSDNNLEYELYKDIDNIIKTVKSKYGFDNKEYKLLIKKSNDNNIVKSIKEHIYQEYKNSRPSKTFFILKELGEIEFTIEYLISCDKYRKLFSNKEIAFSRHSLIEYGNLEGDKYSLDILSYKFFKLCDFLEEHHLSPTWVLTTVIVVISGILRFLIYLHELGKCSFWNIPSEAIRLNTNSIFDFLSYICLAAFVIIYSVLIYLPLSIKTKDVRIKISKIILELLIFVSLMLFAYALAGNIKLSFFIAALFHFICLIPAISRLFKKKKRINNRIDISSMGTYEYIFFAFTTIMIIALLFFSGWNNEKSKKTYNLVNNEYVIVYSNDTNHYLKQFDSNTNTIYKNHTKVVGANEIEYKTIAFNEVNIR